MIEEKILGIVSHEPSNARIVRTVFFDSDCWFVAVDITDITGINMYPAKKGFGRHVKSEMVVRPSGSLSKTKIISIDGVKEALTLSGNNSLIQWFSDTYQRDLSVYKVKERVMRVLNESISNANAEAVSAINSEPDTREDAVDATVQEQGEQAPNSEGGLLSDLAECKQAISLALSMLDELEIKLIEQLKSTDSSGDLFTTSDDYVCLSDMTDIGVRRVYSIARRLGVIGPNCLAIRDSKGGAFAVKIKNSRNGRPESFLAANARGIEMLREEAKKW